MIPEREETHQTPDPPDPATYENTGPPDGADGLSRVGADGPEPEVEWDKAWKGVFLASLSRIPVIATACRAAGRSRTTAYDERAVDAAFAAAWRDALEESVDLGEQEAWRRGTVGSRREESTEKLDAEGRVVERTVKTVQEVSDRLLIAALAAHRPEKWRTNVKLEASGPDGGPIQHQLLPVEEAAAAFDAEVRRLALVPGEEHDVVDVDAASAS